MFNFDFTTMPYNSLFEVMASIKPGTMARISYKTDLPLKAEFRRQGYRLVKITETTARFGVKYSNIKSVIARRSSPDYTPVTRENNTLWLLENKISQNVKTGRIHVRFAPMANGANKKKLYIFVDTIGNMFELGSDMSDSFKAMVQDSYWKSKHMPDVQTICVEDVLYIRQNTK